MRCVALVAMLALAGCVGPVATPAQPSQDAHASGAPILLNLAPCDTVRMITTVPTATARPLLPPAFEPVVTGGDRVEAIFGGVSCQGEGARRVFVEISAQPVNASWRDPSVTRHYYEPELDAQPDDGAAMAWSAVGGAARNATIQVSASGITVKAANFTHTLVLTSGPGAPGGAALAPGTSREWAAARGGFAFLDSAYSGGQLQAGVAQLSAGAGTPAAKLFGESQEGPGIALTGTTFAGARVGYVPVEGSDGH